MGMGQSSTRKITLINDEQSGVVKLSESLAMRLRGDLEKEIKDSHKSSDKDKNVDVKAPSEYLNNAEDEAQSKESLHIPKKTEHDFDMWQKYSKGNANLEQARDEMKLEIKLRDEQWRDRIKQRDLEYAQINNLQEEELQKSAKEIEEMFSRVSSEPTPCDEHQNKVLECYQKYPSQSLRCSNEVQEFARCANLGKLIKPSKVC